jgi:hypothetical protein
VFAHDRLTFESNAANCERNDWYYLFFHPSHSSQLKFITRCATNTNTDAHPVNMETQKEQEPENYFLLNFTLTER